MSTFATTDHEMYFLHCSVAALLLLLQPQELLELLQGDGHDAAVLSSTSHSIQQQSRALAAALEVLQLQLSPGLHPQALELGLVDGHSLALVLLLVKETGLWLVVCLEVRVRGWSSGLHSVSGFCFPQLLASWLGSCEGRWMARKLCSSLLYIRYWVALSLFMRYHSNVPQVPHLDMSF